MPPTKLDIPELRRLVEWLDPSPSVGIGDGIVQRESWNSLRNAAVALLDEIERLRKMEAAARAYCDPGRHAHNCTKGTGMSWEPEYPCSCGLDALREALRGTDAK